MGLNDQRILFSDNGTLSDYSVNLLDFRGATTEPLPFVAAEDALYFASFMPFNHKHIDVGTVNTAVSSVTIDIWDGDEWNAATDIIDNTADASGASLAQDGIIRWTPDREEGWSRETDSFEVDGLATTENTREIYNMYWVRMKFSADLDAGTTLKFVGHKFSGDNDLFGEYPDLNQAALQAAFETGKSDWLNEAYVAAEKIIRDLRKKSAIFSGDQILDYELFKDASVHKTAEIIFHGLGNTYRDLKDNARKEYFDAFDIAFLRLDKTRDARLNPVERQLRTGVLTR